MSSKKAAILTIGDEILAGDIVDSNKSRLAKFCRNHGITVLRAVSIRDRVDEIVDELRNLSSEVELCLMSGGLGPTSDDLTAEAVALAAGCSLERRPEAIRHIEELFARYGRTPTEVNFKQADLPEGADLLENPVGTAVGFGVEIKNPHDEKKRLLAFAMPGVPVELEKMLAEQVSPRIVEKFGQIRIPSRTHRILGYGESKVHQILLPFWEQLKSTQDYRDLWVRYRAHHPDLEITLELPGASSLEEADRLLTAIDGEVAERLGVTWMGVGPASVAERAFEKLQERKWTLATAESCTGGGIGQLITEIPGASEVFAGGIISYSNQAKADLLGVDPRVIVEEGAVSEAVVKAMAEGARERLRVDIAVAVSGIAGPGGGSEDKSVGTVDVAVADKVGTVARRLKLPGKREIVRKATAKWAMKMVWDRLQA